MFVIAKMDRGAYRVLTGGFPSVNAAQSFLVQKKLPVPTYQVVDLTALTFNHVAA
jgi:hypothetical protein